MTAMHEQDAPSPTLGHIMGAIEGCEASRDELRDMITAAIAEARREGAEQMLIDAGMLCAVQADEADGDIAYRDACHDCAKAIRALPLPTGPRQAVRLTDDEVKATCAKIAEQVAQNCGSIPQLTFPHIYLGVEDLLKANGMGTK